MSKNKKQTDMEVGRGVALEKMCSTAMFLKMRIQVLEELESYGGNTWQNLAVEVEKGMAIEKLKITYKELQKQYDQYFPNIKQAKESVHQTNIGSPSDTLFTVTQFIQKHPCFTEGGMRFYIFHEHTNGLAQSGAVFRVGRKVLIDEEKFFIWIRTQNAISK